MGNPQHLASKDRNTAHLQDQIATQGIQSLNFLTKRTERVCSCNTLTSVNNHLSTFQSTSSQSYEPRITNSWMQKKGTCHGWNWLHTTNTICCETNSKGYRSQATSNSAFASLGKAGQSWTTHGFLWGKVTGKRMRTRSHSQSVTFIFWSFDWMYSSCSMSLCSTNPQTYSKGNC